MSYDKYLRSFYLGRESGIPTISNILVLKMLGLAWEISVEHDTVM